MTIKEHCTKNHISQVRRWNRKLKSTKQISSFHQIFGTKRDRISHLRKIQNKTFSAISKYNPSMTFLAEKDTVFPIYGELKIRFFPVISKFHLSINFLAQKRPYYLSPKNSKQEVFNNHLTWNSMLKKISSYRFIRTERSYFSVLKISCIFLKY